MKLGKPLHYFYTWRRWFAWHPVRVNDGSYRWLETVERRTFDGGMFYYYREKR